MVGAGLSYILGRRGDDVLLPEGYKSNAFSLILSTVAINILGLSLPIMTLQVYDRVLPNQGSGTLPVLVTGVCLAIVLEACLRLSRAYVTGRSGATYEHMIANGAMQKILNADLSRMGSYGVGEHLHRLASVSKLKDFYNGNSLITLTELLFVPIFLGLILYISGWLVAVPLVAIVIFAFLSFVKGFHLRDALHAREVADDKRFNFLIETLEGIHTVKSFSLERQFERKYETLEELSTRENYAVTQERAGIFNTGSIFSHLMVVCVISIGAWLVLSHSLTTGALIATLLLSGRVMQPVQKALALWVRYQDYSLAHKNITSLFDTPQQQIANADSNYNSSSNGELEINNLCFRFLDDESNILNKLDLKVDQGDVALINGAHGSGKTTLLNLIAGVYPPTEGEIIVDQNNINKYTPEKLTRHIGYIKTRGVIFRGTIRDNITCFGQSENEKVKEIAALFEVDRDVAKLPGGFDSFLNGDNTDNIPAGLKQKISIVRVLASKPRIILYDNADHSLDKKGYIMMYNLLARLVGMASMVLVSDDANISNLAKSRYELRNGVLQRIEKKETSSVIHPYRELKL